MNRGARVQTPAGPGRVFGPQHDRWTAAAIAGWWVDVDGRGRKCFRVDELAPLPGEIASV